MFRGKLPSKSSTKVNRLPTSKPTTKLEVKLDFTPKIMGNARVFCFESNSDLPFLKNKLS